jgi:steroid 5-alpha reductase family enzyme
MFEYLAFMLLFSVGFNIVMFIPAYLTQTDKLTDISYALSFLGLSSFSYYFSDRSLGATILYIAVLLWSFRIGSFLFMRIQRMKRDKRFDGMRENIFRFLGFWLLQGLTVFVVLLGPLVYWADPRGGVGVLAIVGLLIFSKGLIVEAVADLQKFKFSGDKKNRDKWIESGLWGYSRHPNYLGEMTVWVGLCIYVVSSTLSSSEFALALVSPIYIIALLLFVSGVPLLEKSADKKWGTRKEYQAYKKRVPVLIPRLTK